MPQKQIFTPNPNKIQNQNQNLNPNQNQDLNQILNHSQDLLNQNQNSSFTPSEHTSYNQDQNFVPSELSKRSMPKAGKIIGIIFATTVGVLLLSFGIVYLMKYLSDQAEQAKNNNQNTKVIRNHIDLQPVLDQWLSKQVNKKNSGILVYDFDNQEIIAHNNDSSKFNITGLEDLFLIYEIYTRLGQKKWQITDTLNLTTGPTTRDVCISKLLQERDNICRNFFIEEIGQANLQAIIKEQSYSNTDPLAHLSTASDMLTLLKRLVAHPDFSNELWQDLKIKMNTQNKTRVGFTAGFSKLESFGISGLLMSSNTVPSNPTPENNSSDDISSTPPTFEAKSQNFIAYNGAFLLEKTLPGSSQKHSFLLICLTSDTHPSALTDLASLLDTAISK